MLNIEVRAKRVSIVLVRIDERDALLEVGGQALRRSLRLLKRWEWIRQSGVGGQESVAGGDERRGLAKAGLVDAKCSQIEVEHANPRTKDRLSSERSGFPGYAQPRTEISAGMVNVA